MSPMNADSAARLYCARIAALRKLLSMGLISTSRCRREISHLRHDLSVALRSGQHHKEDSR